MWLWLYATEGVTYIAYLVHVLKVPLLGLQYLPYPHTTYISTMLRSSLTFIKLPFSPNSTRVWDQ